MIKAERHEGGNGIAGGFSTSPAYEHGGDWEGFRQRWGRDPLDFSVNVSPLGVPDSVVVALTRSTSLLDRYPDPWCRKLRADIGRNLDIDPSWVLCGAGAADLIYRCVAAAKPKRALITAPTFGGYGRALQVNGVDIVRYPLDERRGFRLDERIIDRLDSRGEDGIDMVFLCEPNNPTGMFTHRELLLDILEICTVRHIRLVVDESFIDFAADPAGTTMATRLSSSPSLVVLRSFTKIFGMAGLRLGYALSSDLDFLAAMQAAGPWWNVSVPAQEAGIAALCDDDYVNRVRALVAKERPALVRALAGLGFRVIDGDANYVLFQSEISLTASLEEAGILIRSCESFEGLDERWYRVAVRSHEDNMRLIAALHTIVQSETETGRQCGPKRGAAPTARRDGEGSHAENNGD